MARHHIRISARATLLDCRGLRVTLLGVSLRSSILDRLRSRELHRDIHKLVTVAEVFIFCRRKLVEQSLIHTSFSGGAVHVLTSSCTLLQPHFVLPLDTNNA